MIIIIIIENKTRNACTFIRSRTYLNFCIPCMVLVMSVMSITQISTFFYAASRIHSVSKVFAYRPRGNPIETRVKVFDIIQELNNCALLPKFEWTCYRNGKTAPNPTYVFAIVMAAAQTQSTFFFTKRNIFKCRQVISDSGLLFQ